ncbi:DUF397 domain-containing protein [Streptomyces sp. TRM66268-LWL]|uniref:DUF397 domain-containing protein n=1 Tax=Streptomyces polyasparticus TaxID=2767826 RepID=A0ABR7SUG3_9ACTN|nr:DUF397 domain-containing protein [Streptomyces polyasparticus]MBC9719137.1 DUF397 domain-containing protein [Streptomyces polyasparticus]
MHAWQKSSHCGSGDSCVHVASTPQKSSYCGEGESCVHVDAAPGTIHLTESSDPTGAIVRTTPAAFSALIQGIKAGHPTGGPLRVDAEGDTIRVRDQAAPDTVMTTSAGRWHTFELGVRDGEFDHFATP